MGIKKYGFWKALFGKKDVETKEYEPFVQVKLKDLEGMSNEQIVDGITKTSFFYLIKKLKQNDLQIFRSTI